MAARGNESKNIIIAKLLETFSGSFIYDKNVIIPMIENGENLQIKIALTCSKTNVTAGGDTALPGATPSAATPARGQRANTSTVAEEPTEEEKQAIKDFLSQF